MTRVLTQTELATWLRCRRRWYLSFYRRLRRKRFEGGVVNVGQLVHSGLEAYYRNKTNPLEVVSAAAEESLARHPESAEEISKEAELAGIMLQGYMEWVAETGADTNLEIVGVEQPVEVPFGPYRLRGKIDAPVVRRSDGLRLQLEHKSVANLSDLPQTAQSNFQFLTYDLLAFLAARNLEPGVQRTDGLIINMLRRVKRSKTAHPPFYGRHEVRHNLEELRNHWRHVMALARETDAATVQLDAGRAHHFVAPPTPNRTCTYECPFAEVCLTGMLDDGSDSEGMLAAGWEAWDPLERYGEEP